MAPPDVPSRVSEARIGASRVLLVGTIQGLKGESQHVRRAWDSLGGADGIAVGVGAEDVANLQRMGAHPEGVAEFLSQELDTGSYEEAILPQLARFGDIAMPPDDLLEAEALSRRHGVPLVPLDLDDDAHSDLYVEHLSGWQMIRGQLKQKRLVARGADQARSPEELMTIWDASFRSIRGYDRVEMAREDFMAGRVRELAKERSRLLVVLPYARLAGVVKRLGPAQS